MASIFTTLTRPFRPSLDNQTPIEKSESKSFAVGYLPGVSTSLRETVIGQPTDTDYDLLYRIYDINTDVSGSIDQWIGVTTGNDWSIAFEDAEYEPTDDDKDLIRNVEAWLRNPNPDKGLKFDELIEETIIDLAVCGDAYWEVVRDNKGVPVEVSNIHPSTVRVVSDEHGVIKGYIQILNGRVVARFEPKDIMHFRLPSRRSDLYGQSPLERALEEITQDIKAMVANKSLLDNGFNPGAILLLNPEADNETNAQRIKQMIAQSHAGTNRWHRLMVGLGIKDIKPWGNTLKDMQFTALRALATTKIATAFGVPKLFLNQKESGSDAQSNVLERQLYKNKGKKIQKLLNGIITEDLVQSFDQRLAFTFNPPDFSDTDALRRDAIDLHKANPDAITANELRSEYFGLQELDEEEQDGTEQEADDLEGPPEEILDDEGNERTAVDPDDVESDDAKKSVVTKAIDDDIHPLAIDRDAQMEALEQDLIQPVRDAFSEQEADYLARLPDDLTESSLDTYLTAGREAIDTAFALALGSFLYTPLKAGVAATVSQMYSETGNTTEGNLRIDMTLRFDQVNPVIQRYIQSTAFEHVQGINATTRAQLRASLSEGLRLGEGIPQLSERIAQVFGRARDYRTDMIAQTETARAFQFANHAAGELLFKEGIVRYRQWLTAPEAEGGSSDRVCAICRPLNKYVIRFDAKYPDELEPSEAHIRCRCTEVYRVGDEDELPDWRRL